MSRQVSAGEGVPSVFYRNAIDLNRFSNSVSKKLVTSYNNVMLKAVSQLEQIERQPLSKQPAYKTARLRALIKQTKQSLNSWANGSVDDLITELEGVAKVQAGFIEGQLKKSIPKGMAQKITDQIGYSVRSVAVSPSFAKSVVTTDPTAINLAVLKSELAGITKDKKARTKGTFKLTAEQGQTITLPNGNTVKKSFLGIAQAEAKRLNQVVRSGLLSGETTTDIVKDLVGNLRKDQKGSLSQLLAQGGAATKSANNQVMTIVRTTVNQVTNTASQTVYKANPDVTEEYRYVATLDSRTSPVCRDLDGQIFKYNQGPVPPQHFGCRSTTVAVVNYKKWDFTPPPAGKRASVGGPVPANTTYGKWLYGERAKGSKFEPGAEQIAALGKQKAKYFNRLSNKYGPDQALKKLIREDNTEVSLAQLQKRYGKPEDIKAKVIKKKAAAPKITTPPVKPSPAIKKIDKEIAETKKQLQEAKAQLKALEERDPSLPTVAQLQAIPVKSKVQAIDVNNAFNLMEKMEGEAGKNAKKLINFMEKKQIFCSWTTPGVARGNYLKVAENVKYIKENPQLRKSLQLNKQRGTKKVRNTSPSYDPLHLKHLEDNETRTLRGLNKMNTILEEGLDSSTGYGNALFETFFTMKKTTAYGYTLQGSNHIVMRVQPYHKKIKDLSKIKTAISNSIKNAAKNTPLGNVDNDLYKFTGRKITDGDSWLTTFVHEMGHQVHYAANRPAMKGSTWIPSKYGGTNFMEEFAETFVQYIFKPVELKKASPNAFKWIDDAMKNALSSVD